MPKVTYIESNGAAHVIEVPLDETVMRGALYNGVLWTRTGLPGSEGPASTAERKQY